MTHHCRISFSVTETETSENAFNRVRATDSNEEQRLVESVRQTEWAKLEWKLETKEVEARGISQQRSLLSLQMRTRLTC